MKTSTRDSSRTIGLIALLTVSSWALADAAPPPASPAPAPPADAAAPADTSAEHTSYLFGLIFGDQLRAAGLSAELDQAAIARGVQEGLAGKKSTRADQQQVQAFVRATMTAAIAHNQQAAKDFLAKNGQEKGVITTADGLQYKILAAGNKKAPAIQPTDEVTVQYKGTLLDGTTFDSSYERNAPATFKVNGVIKGWQEALVLMKPGAKWTLFVPPELGYDSAPRPGIPGGSLLIFEVELVSVKAAETPPAADSKEPTSPKSSPASHLVVPPLKQAAPASSLSNP